MARKQGDFGRLVLLALDFLADPAGFEFVEDFAQALAGDFHLIQGLGGGEPRGGTVFGGHQRFSACCLRRYMVNAARAASPPLSQPRAVGALHRLRLGLDRQYAIAERNLPSDGQVHQGAGALAGDDLEMIGLAANDAAERNDASRKERPTSSAASSKIAAAAGISSAPGARTSVQRACAASSACVAPSSCRAPMAS